MGLIVHVYRSARIGDCTAGGVSGRFDSLTLVNAEGPFDPAPDRPAVMVVRGPHTGRDDNPVVVPAERRKGEWREVRTGARMFGGNYASTSDSRFGAAIARACGIRRASPVLPIHDRFE